MNQSHNATTSSTQLLILPLTHYSVIPICLAAPGFSGSAHGGEFLVAGFGRRQIPHCLTDISGPEQELSKFSCTETRPDSLCLVHYSLPSVVALTTARAGLAAAASTSSTTALDTRRASRTRTPLRRSTPTVAGCGNGCRARNPAYRTSFTTANTSKVVFRGRVQRRGRREVTS